MENRRRDPIAEDLIKYGENLTRGKETLNPPQVSFDPPTFHDKLWNRYLPTLVTGVGGGVTGVSILHHDMERMVVGVAIGAIGFIWSGASRSV